MASVATEGMRVQTWRRFYSSFVLFFLPFPQLSRMLLREPHMLLALHRSIEKVLLEESNLKSRRPADGAVAHPQALEIVSLSEWVVLLLLEN